MWVLGGNCCTYLTYALHLLFSQSLRECHLPSLWKASIVLPVYKKKVLLWTTSQLVRNLCPASVLNALLLARTAHLKDNNILTEHQFGLCWGSSTLDQLFLLYDDVSKCPDDGSVVELIMYDFAKASDSASHRILLTKLSLLGTDTHHVPWVADFSCWMQKPVSVKDRSSRPHLVTSGVPQGSILGPIHFLVFADHIANDLACQYKIFADELKI